MPFDVKTDYGPYVDGKPRQDGTDSFLALPRHRRCLRAARTTRRTPRRSTALATEKNDLVQEKIVTAGWTSTRARCATCRPCGTPG